MPCFIPLWKLMKAIKSHYELSDQEFETQFTRGDFPPSLFTHEAHLRLAWVYLKKYGVQTAEQKISAQIQQFDQRHGKGDKFHKTLTVAAVKVVHHFMLKSKANAFADFLHEFPRLETSFKALLDQHYSPNIFLEEPAKHYFIEPDLLPFD